MSKDQKISFSCLEVRQPIGTFYVGVMAAQDVVFISKADIRRIEEDDIGLAIGIQRHVNPKRVKEIADYVETSDAAFPTSIILAIDSKHAKYKKSEMRMYIERTEEIASVIDGQHRLKGLEGFTKQFELNVTIFIDMETQDKANVFATINLAQTKVNKSLVYDLYEYATTRSPQKTCHDIAKIMNYEDDSPFFRSIKILGFSSPESGGGETITQAAFVESLLEFISKEPLKDRDQLKRGLPLQRAEGREALTFCFRDLFIDEKDAEIAKTIWNYFDAVAERWPKAWLEVRQGEILNRSTGFRALMRFLRDCYVSFDRPSEVPSKKRFATIFSKIKLSESKFTTNEYKPGSSGETQLLRDLRELSGIPDYSE